MKKQQIDTENKSFEEEISSQDFVESNKDVIYKERVKYVLDKKYPKELKSFTKWLEILKKEGI